MDGNWFVVQVMSGHEMKVKKSIEESITKNNLENTVFEVVVPTEKVIEVKKGEQKVSEKRLWPGYALIRMNLSDEAWMHIKETSGVIGFIGGGEPVPLTTTEVDQMLSDLKNNKDEPSFKNKIQPGDNVKIVDGVFVNFIGTVEEVNNEKGKLSAMVSIFGRDTRVDDLEFWQVEEVSVDDTPQ